MVEEVQGRLFHDIIHHSRPDGTPCPREEYPIDRAFPQHNQEQSREVSIHKDGSLDPVEFVTSPIRAAGEIAGSIIEVREVSEK